MAAEKEISSMTKFVAHNKVRMHDTDMAGILYFARIFRFAHDALEELVASESLSFGTLFEQENFVFVIVHCDADFHASVSVGDLIETHLYIVNISSCSFTIHYDFFKVDNSKMGSARTVHVTLERASRKKIAIPDKLHIILEKYYAEESLAK